MFITSQSHVYFKAMHYPCNDCPNH